MNSVTKIVANTDYIAAFLISSLRDPFAYRSMISELYQLLSEEQLLYLKNAKIDSLVYRHLRPVPPAQTVYNKVWRIQRSALLAILEKLRVANVDVMVYKGAEYVERFFDSIPICLMHDIDIIVPIDRTQEVKELLRDSGFRQADLNIDSFQLVDRDPEEIVLYEQNSYELYAFSKVLRFEVNTKELENSLLWAQPPVWADGSEAVLLLTIDVHKSVSNDIHPDFFWKRRWQSAIGQASALDPTDQLWVTALKYYFEVAVHDQIGRLRDLAYMTRLLSDHAVEWPLIIDIANRLDIRPAIFYTLGYISCLSNGSLPPDVSTNLAPTLGSRSRDFGWQLHKLFGEVSEIPTDTISGAASVKAALDSLRKAAHQP